MCAPHPPTPPPPHLPARPDHYRLEEDGGLQLTVYNVVMALCTKLYYTECVFKLFGLGVGGYFASGWNRFEFVLVFTALLEDVALELVGPYLPLPPTLLRVIRIARLLRILRLLRSLEGLRNVVMTLFLSFPSFVNVAGLLMLVIFMYAVLGVQLFYSVQSGVVLRGEHSFRSVASASQLLFQCLTGDGWSGMMLDATASACEWDPASDAASADAGMGSWYAQLQSFVDVHGACGMSYGFFITFMLIGLFVLANLIVAVILQNFSSLGDLNPDVASKNDIESFSEKWALVDTAGNGFIAAEALPTLLILLDRPLRPLGIPAHDAPANRVMARNVIAELVRKNLFPERFTSSGYLNCARARTSEQPARRLPCSVQCIPPLSLAVSFCHDASPRTPLSRLTHRRADNFVLDHLVKFSFEHYNELHVDNRIEAPPALKRETAWVRLRRLLRDDAASVLLSFHYSLPAASRSIGGIVRALTAQGTLGRGSTAQQLRSLTEIVRVQADKVDSLEVRLTERSVKVDRLEARLGEKAEQVERLETRLARVFARMIGDADDEQVAGERTNEEPPAASTTASGDHVGVEAMLMQEEREARAVELADLPADWRAAVERQAVKTSSAATASEGSTPWRAAALRELGTSREEGGSPGSRI